MPRNKPHTALVTLTHPSGHFKVHVAQARAREFEARGYRREDAAEPAPKRTTPSKAKEAP